jgi:dTDP-4-dehydrorhamnose 3,5-epimerase
VKVTKFSIQGPLLIEPKMIGDSRGFFVERFRKDVYLELGLPEFIQDNYSRSSGQVLRGLHFQYDRPQGKLVSAVRGAIFDVAVDIRETSPTFGQHVAVELHGDRPAWFWVPAGFAHGFRVLSAEGADLLYKVNADYNAQGEGGIAFDDSDLGIQWPGSSPEISERDRKMPSWKAYLVQPRF